MKSWTCGLVAAIVFMSCKHDAEYTVEGWWSIDTFYYGQYDVSSCVLGNSIFFRKKGKASFPLSDNFCDTIFKAPKLNYPLNKEENNVEWQVLDDSPYPLTLQLKSQTEAYSGLHKMVFRKDEANELFVMEISSDSLYIVCRKGLFNYPKRHMIMDDLIRRGNGE